MSKKSDILYRYWFEFEKPVVENPDGGIHLICWPPFGCGVTAYDYSDALALMRRQVFGDRPFPRIIVALSDIDIDVLLANNKHLGPSRCCPVWRGVWWPNQCSSGPFIGSAYNEW